jgi:dTDP-4-dehydrorhamnose reductase
VNILVLGATGMLGSAVFRILSEADGMQVFGTIRSEAARQYFAPELASRLIFTEDLDDKGTLQNLFDFVTPRVVINCVALEKSTRSDPMMSISIFSLLPHRLALLCRVRSARLIQISSDGVFSGSRGGYKEDDYPDATDVYGIAKLLGEVNYPHAITLRTSIIGHQVQTKTGLLEWFLMQNNNCQCYSRSIFSGLPTVVLAQIIRDVLLPRPDLHGIYHVASKAISKFDLLRLVAETYGKSIKIIPVDEPVIDRSLNADRFQTETGYIPPDWPELIRIMHFYK